MNLDSGRLLYFDSPTATINTNLPQKPEDLIGYIPPGIEQMRLIVFPGLLMINQAREQEMRFDHARGKIIAKDNKEYDVEVL